MNFDRSRFSRRMDWSWIEEKDSVASRPAWRVITVVLLIFDEKVMGFG